MAIKRLNREVDRQALRNVGFEIGMAEWVRAKATIPVKNLSSLKRLLQVGTLFEILDHQKEAHRGEIWEVVSVQNNCIWSVIHGDPDHEVSKANNGKGYRMDYGKATDYEFGETIKWFKGNASIKNSHLIMEFVILTPRPGR